jgi:hypothetical protein
MTFDFGLGIGGTCLLGVVCLFGIVPIGGVVHLQEHLKTLEKGVKRVGENEGKLMLNAIEVPACAGQAVNDTASSVGEGNPLSETAETEVEGVSNVLGSVGDAVK